jgi:hypothetical protein
MKILSAVLISCALFACGGTQKPKMDPKKELEQLMVLYQENRPKFVIQKQEMIDGECDRATRVRQAADEMVAEQAMNPAKNETLTLVHMELQQAEKACLEK